MFCISVNPVPVSSSHAACNNPTLCRCMLLKYDTNFLILSKVLYSHLLLGVILPCSNEWRVTNCLFSRHGLISQSFPFASILFFWVTPREGKDLHFLFKWSVPLLLLISNKWKKSSTWNASTVDGKGMNMRWSHWFLIIPDSEIIKRVTER